MSDAVADDPTLAFLAKLDDPELFERMENVPIFRPHRKKKKTADGKWVEVEVTEDDLPKIADIANRRLQESGVPVLFTIGHRLRDPEAPERKQPPIVGYGLDVRPGTFGKEKQPCLLCTRYLRRDMAAEAKRHKGRSAEYYPGRKELTSVGHLTRDPELDLGIVDYTDGGYVLYSREDSDMAEEMPADPTAPPDAAVTPEPAPAPEPDGDEAKDKAFEAEHYGHPGAAAYYQRKCAQYAANPAMPGATNVATPGEPAPGTPPELFARGEQAAHYARVEAENRDLKRKQTTAEKRAADAEKRIAGLERKNREHERRGVLVEFCRELTMDLDVDAELQQVLDYSDQQFKAHLAVIERARKAKVKEEAPVGGDFLPAAKPTKGGKKDLDEAQTEVATQYMREQGCSWKEAREHVLSGKA